MNEITVRLIRLLQARLAQFHFASDSEKAFASGSSLLYQRLAGDIAGAKVTAEQARNTLERLYKDKQDRHDWRARTSRRGLPVSSLCFDGEKDSALKRSKACSHALAPC